MSAIGVSSMEYGQKGYFGTFKAPLFGDETTDNINERGACIEFRCPGRVIDGGTPVSDVATLLNVQVLSQERHFCNITYVYISLTIKSCLNNHT